MRSMVMGPAPVPPVSLAWLSPTGNEFTCTPDGSDRAVVLERRYQSWLEERRAIEDVVDAYGYSVHVLTETRQCD
jgi:hypothetical protein